MATYGDAPSVDSQLAHDVRRWEGVAEVLALALLAGLLLSPQLWLSSRLYPLAPVFGLWPSVSAPFDGILFVALLGLLVAVPLVPWPRPFMVVVLVLMGLLCLGDQTRWQPWVYQYLIMMAALALMRPPAGEGQGTPAGLNVCRLIVACTYFWSGLQKLNDGFRTDTFRWFIEPFQPFLPDTICETLSHASLAPPLIESAIGIGLLVPILRPTAIGGAVAMHAAILFAIGPLGHDWNTVVWPWNIAMVFLVVRLFARSRDVPLRAVVWPGRSVVKWAVVLLFGVLPLLSFWGLWDSYLSAALYCGNELEAIVVVPKAVLEGMPDSGRDLVRYRGSGTYEVDLWKWSYREMNVPPYPARRVFRRIAWNLGNRIGDPDAVKVTFKEPRKASLFPGPDPPGTQDDLK